MSKEQGGAKDSAGQPVPEGKSAGMTVSLDDLRAAAARARASTQETPASGEGAPGKAEGEAGGSKEAGVPEGKPQGAAPAEGTPTPEGKPAGESEPKPGEGEGEEDPNLDHADRTRLGRSMARLRTENAEIKGELTATRGLLEKLVAGMGKPAEPAAGEHPALPDLGDDEAVMTVGDVRKLLAGEEAKRTKADEDAKSERLKFGRDFMAQFGVEEFKKDPLMPKIQILMMGNIQANKPEFNTRYSGNAAADFRTNFLAAKAHVLSGAAVPDPETPTKKEPTKGEKPSAALGVGGDGSGKPANKASAPIAVDPIGKSFLRYLSEKGEDSDALARRAFAVEPRADLTRGTGRHGDAIR